jgi:cell division septation protein DedD
MAKNQNRRLDAPVRKADEDALRALRAIGDYQPLNPAYNLEALTAKHESVRRALETELDAQDALAAARDAAVAALWDYHNAILGAKEQAIAQYGSSSDQVASLGLKKKSERKTPVRKSKPPVPPGAQPTS